MSKINDGGPAFPFPSDDGPGQFQPSRGMTLRDWFASQCPLTVQEAWGIWTSRESLPFLRTVASANERAPFFEYFAMLRFEYADAMLAERAKGGA